MKDFIEFIRYFKWFYIIYIVLVFLAIFFASEGEDKKQHSQDLNANCVLVNNGDVCTIYFEGD